MSKPSKSARKQLQTMIDQIDVLYPTVDKPAKQADLLLERSGLVKSIIAIDDADDAGRLSAADQEITVLNEQLSIMTAQIAELEQANRQLQTAVTLARISAPQASPQASREQADIPKPLTRPAAPTTHDELRSCGVPMPPKAATPVAPVKIAPPVPVPFVEDLRPASVKLAEAKAMTRSAW